MSAPLHRRRFRFYGTVQGVGFRWRARHAAEGLGLTGWVRNEYDGSVTLELQGGDGQLDRALEMLENGRFLSIDRMEVQTVPLDEDERGFHTLG